MTNDEAKMAEEICTLRSTLKAVSDYLNDVLESGLPGKGRSDAERESIQIWWEDRAAALKRAEQLLEATSEYQGVIVR